MLSHHIKNIKLPAWLKENKRLRTASLLCVGLFCADLLLYYLLVVPSTERLTAGETSFAELKKRRTEAILFQKQKQELAGIRAGIPAQKDMPLLVKELVQTARRLNLTVSSINYDIPKRGGEEIAMLTFSFPVEGRYADVKRFIYEVETSDRFVGIQDMKLESDNGRVKLQMKLVTYIKGQ
jgi:Tfp pilus assembly protein PilO